ncbi:unnamed protein product [Cuscuta epithymum]|uniref:Uncharacterized protein n=1 Tax=Cuscuta epithymum TaxID=186058 RepID=A0AAV0FNE4_9ASTE|nr:unnamed protein product [Cuscuta epithymum]
MEKSEPTSSSAQGTKRKHDYDSDSDGGRGIQRTIRSLPSSSSDEDPMMEMEHTIPVYKRKFRHVEKEKVADINLVGVRGFSSFARKVSGAAGRQPSVTSHVAWPWKGFDAKYLKKGGAELNPLLISWTDFVSDIDHILMDENWQFCGFEIPVTFKRKTGLVLINSHMLLLDSLIKDRECFTQALHYLWATWSGNEPGLGAEDDEIAPGCDLIFTAAGEKITELPKDEPGWRRVQTFVF